MKFLTLFISLFLAFQVAAQKPEPALASAAGHIFTRQSLSAEGQKIFDNQARLIAESRSSAMSQMIADILIGFEAKVRNSSAEKILSEETAKIAAPSNEEIQTVYTANKESLQNKPLTEVRDQIVAFLKRESEQKSLQTYFQGLQAKYKVAFGKDVNAANRTPFDTLATVGSKTISPTEFESANKLALYETRAEIYDEIKADLDASIFSTLVGVEAKSRNIDLSELMAAEITGKLRDHSPEERYEVESAFQKRLFIKYAVKFELKEPPPLVQNISADDDPADGKFGAPVTVIMFSDFQCSACAQIYPVLKKVLAEYGDKIRFVVRDFPLESIHENAFRAALAANAANAQGKYTEYTEILYQKQDALDTASLKKYAADLGLNVKQFEIDLNGGKAAAEIRKDMADGNSYGIRGTPAIFVNGVKIRRFSADEMRKAIDRSLAK